MANYICPANYGDSMSVLESDLVSDLKLPLLLDLELGLVPFFVGCLRACEKDLEPFLSSSLGSEPESVLDIEIGKYSEYSLDPEGDLDFVEAVRRECSEFLRVLRFEDFDSGFVEVSLFFLFELPAFLLGGIDLVLDVAFELDVVLGFEVVCESDVAFELGVGFGKYSELSLGFGFEARLGNFALTEAFDSLSARCSESNFNSLDLISALGSALDSLDDFRFSNLLGLLFVRCGLVSFSSTLFWLVGLSLNSLFLLEMLSLLSSLFRVNGLKPDLNSSC